MSTNNDKNNGDNPAEAGDNTFATIKEYLHLETPNLRSRNVLYTFSVVMSTFWPLGWRDTVVHASLEVLRLFYTLGHQSKTADI